VAATNTLLTDTKITREALRVLENNTVAARHVNREYSDEFAVAGAKIGNSINIRKPPRYVVSSGATLTHQDSTETSVTLTLSSQKHVGMDFTSKDLTLSIDDFSKRFISPATAALGNKVDADVLGQYKYFYNAVGTAGTVPSTLYDYLSAGVALDNGAAPQDEFRGLFITPRMQAKIVDALKGLFQSSSEIAAQYRKGKMGEAAGFSWFMDQNCATHTTGTFTGTPLVNGAAQSGAALILDGATNSVTGWAKDGDVFTIAGVYATNPMDQAVSTGELAQFRVTADANSSGGGAVTLAISPSIVTSGATQNVSAGPANDAAITFIGAATTASRQGLAMHRDAIALGFADLRLPKGTDMAARAASKKVGMSIRLVSDYDIEGDQFVTRLDILYGILTVRPELGCRIYS
jgi:hypothetical protein